ncbi:hypothetical protein K9U39_19430 [Rhodoblastus acidophilus]|uniref:DUF2946 domain-containing protein n=1 Tax=Candidatus Rhodoblastus alkanivorans TaxID=2954117 RepID=A0ABS9Z5W0_9HYPH|nr:hypothetical protein [Candidatus Rhodoblastus alkanivorans]MCI4677292.1 hypothetical protein [Candidatus Rhodoblastus alkanivorans]MCI4682027.1 hypothetical protein [Candidatus Rhodoblastus alkanivorans]MDI4643078.1 hypothetical protein [Rhodoblastus acidophilus]
MARALAESRSGNFWRAWLARLAALAFLVQGFGLFAAAPRPAGDVAAVGAAAPGCFHHQTPGDGHAHGSSDFCPMCQALGCALPGAPPPVVVVRADELAIDEISLPAPRLPPRAPPLNKPRARGPPILA